MTIAPVKSRKKLGLALGSGAARGWAHIGVLQGLDELGVKPDVIAGCSVGALVGGAYLTGGLSAFETWARELSPISAISSFSVSPGPGGLVDGKAAFSAFEEFDQLIQALPVKFGAVATDLGDGKEVWITEGYVIDALRASSAIPVLFHAVEREGRWLIDGAVSNPVPVSLARALGADIVIAVDLTAVPKVLERFDPPPPSVPAVIENDAGVSEPNLTEALVRLIGETRKWVDQQLTLARVRQMATPQLFETAYAAADIFQKHLSTARLAIDKPEIMLTPDMRNATPTSFDRADDFIEEGRKALLGKKEEILRALEINDPPTI
ncbi:MAG: patatin-like phospholipase family protein [Pseudomonadota bacterium]